jgi:hypothetical protein
MNEWAHHVAAAKFSKEEIKRCCSEHHQTKDQK